MLTTIVSGARKGPSSRAVAALSVVFTQNKTKPAPRTAHISVEASTGTVLRKCEVSSKRPSRLTASTKLFRPIMTTGAPASAITPPKYPPTAPAPTTATRGQVPGCLIPVTLVYVSIPARKLASHGGAPQRRHNSLKVRHKGRHPFGSRLHGEQGLFEIKIKRQRTCKVIRQLRSNVVGRVHAFSPHKSQKLRMQLDSSFDVLRRSAARFVVQIKNFSLQKHPPL